MFGAATLMTEALYLLMVRMAVGGRRLDDAYLLARSLAGSFVGSTYCL